MDDLTQKLELESFLFRILSDLSTYVIAICNELMLSFDIDDEFITLKPLDLCDIIVLVQQFPEVLGDDVKFVHDFFFEATLLLLVDPVGLFLNDVDHELDFVGISLLHVRNLGYFRSALRSVSDFALWVVVSLLH